VVDCFKYCITNGQVLIVVIILLSYVTLKLLCVSVTLSVLCVAQSPSCFMSFSLLFS
jgi:hypothetical protein